MTAGNAGLFFGSRNICEYGNPATWLGVKADGTLENRYTQAYANTKYLFVGDDTFATAGFNSFVKGLPSQTACNIGIRDMGAKDFAVQSAVNAVAAYQPENIVLSLGAKDLSEGDSAYTTANSIISLMQAYRAALPQTDIYYTPLLPNAQSVTGAHAYTIVNEKITEFAQTAEWLTVLDGVNDLTENNEFKPYLFENGSLSAEGVDALVGEIATELSIQTLNSNVFGNAEYGYTSAAWTVTAEQSNETLTFTDRTGTGKKFAYFKGNAEQTFTASASFSASAVTGGVENPQFGMVMSTEAQRLYFYIQEVYLEGELVQKQLCYQLVEDGVVVETGTLTVGLYYTDGESVSLSINKTQSGIELYVGNYKAFTVERTFDKASVGVYTQNRVITVTSAQKQGGV